MRRAFRQKLYPNPEEEMTLSQFAGVTRLVYNLALEQRQTWRRNYQTITGSNLNFTAQCREITELKKQFDFIDAIPTAALAAAMRDLDRAFSNFFAGRARHPRYRRKGLNDSFRVKGEDLRIEPINARWALVRVPKLGLVRFRKSREIPGRIVNATFSRDALGWHVSFACEIEHEAPANDNPAVGIDRGIAVSLALSNGETFNLPDLAVLDRKRRRAQRVLSRRKRGSNRRRKQLRRVASLSAKIARVRSHWQHCVSRNIASRFATVVMEDLRIMNLSASGRGKRGLNRSILNQSWGAFATKLAYKLEERGGALVKIDPAYTSQTCSDCGAVDSRSRKSQAAFECTSCGFRANADHNAAIIILRRSTSAMPVEGRGCAPVEAGTCLEAA